MMQAENSAPRASKTVSFNVGIVGFGYIGSVIGSGDFNGDGMADILWQNVSSQVGIWFMNGTSVVSTPTLSTIPGPAWHVTGIGDVNGDGYADILWQNDSGQAAVWEMKVRPS
jgi:hypothetical protein